MRVRVATLVFGLICVAAFPSVSHAGPPTAAASKEEFAAGQKLYDEKDFQGALMTFRKVLVDSNSPNARLYVARCLRELGSVVEAYDEMAATLKEATARAEAEPKYIPTRDAAASELALLEPRIGKIVVALAQPSADIEVTLNDKPLAADRIGVPVTVEPGTIRVSARASGKSTPRQDVLIRPGETKTVALTLTGEPIATPDPGAAPGPTQPDTAPRGGTIRTLGFVTAGVGVVGLGVFTFAALSASSKFDTVQRECGNQRCTNPKYADTIDSGKTLDTVSNIGLVTGIVGLTAGTAMIVFGGPREAPASAKAGPKAPPATASIRLSPTSGTIVVKGAF